MRDKSPNNRNNQIVGLLVLIAIVGSCVYVVIKIFEIIRWGVSALGQVASNLDAVVIVALITGAISLVSVIISSIVGKYIEYSNARRAYLAQKREDAYKRFIEMMYRIQENGKKKGSYTNREMVEDVIYFSRELSLWGSSRVVNKWIEFRKKLINGENAADNLFIMEEIMNEMRKDMGCKKVKKGKLLSFFVNDISDYL